MIGRRIVLSVCLKHFLLAVIISSLCLFSSPSSAFENRYMNALASPKGIAIVSFTYAITTGISNFIWAFDWTWIGASDQAKSIVQAVGGLTASLECFVFGAFIPILCYHYLKRHPIHKHRRVGGRVVHEELAEVRTGDEASAGGGGSAGVAANTGNAGSGANPQVGAVPWQVSPQFFVPPAAIPQFYYSQFTTPGFPALGAVYAEGPLHVDDPY